VSVETRETLRVSVAACIAAVLLPAAGCQAIKEWRDPDRAKACIAGGGTWGQDYIGGKPKGGWSCFPPEVPK
jgi:hypothetical protein